MNTDENEFFREATLRICGSLEVEKALWRCFTYIRDFIPANQMILNFFDAQLNTIIIFASAAADGGFRLNTRIPISLEWEEALFDWKQFPELLIINRVGKGSIADRYLEALGKPGSSLLFMRLRIEGELLGNIALRADGRDRFLPEHKRLLSLLNDPWAIALTNSRRYEQLAEFKERLADDNRYLQDELRRMAGDEIIGAEQGLKDVIAMIQSVAPQASPVLLLGETGVGKEVIARAVHRLSPRKEGPFIKVDCGAIPGTLIDSELFGHEKGAFTGAVGRKRGRFERAQGGTIFLDEIGELPLEAQTRLLRVLQDKEIERVGGERPVRVDNRVIAATHRNLEEMVGAGWFRQDLYYRLKVFPVNIPALRDRKADIPDLAAHFLQRKSLELGRDRPPRPAPGAMDRLLAYDWPGNVRELENAVERALLLSRGDSIGFEDLITSPIVQPGDKSERTGEFPVRLDDAMAAHIRNILNKAGGRVEGAGGAAELLGINPGTLRHRMRKLGVSFGRKAKL
ncbi:MAG: sigma 54-interacting transcriptional regulator [Deltaproteobacteria bacterium]|nr:sigma 54-interacting transcriptional regulator [Deltaproteobacteria bacterium]MBW2284509.1 sigma 54-interacting transcriptional regulator [Deltaproteobacteria bacterium]